MGGELSGADSPGGELSDKGFTGSSVGTVYLLK